ncbi:MAG: methyl-accepting chemotaxis protein [Succinivibrionaceae bacterium]|nr:methyl-accepting chemotaxis protein [Succinivibrionaceae bacterium]
MSFSITNKLVLISITAVASVVAVVIALSYINSSTLLENKVRNEILPARIQAITAELQKELQPLLTMSIGMSSDLEKMPQVNTGVATAEDDQKIVEYLTSVKNAYNTSAAFFASSISERYYVYTRFLKVLSKDNEKDRWFYDLIESRKPYLFNLDLDENTGMLSVFLNYMVKDHNGRLLGVAGVGNSLENLTNRINSFNQSDTGKVYLVNERGEIVLGGGDKKAKTIYSDNSVVMKRILDSRDFEIHRIVRNGESYIAGSYYISNIGWHMLMEISEAAVLKDAGRLAIIAVIICLVCIPLFSLLLAVLVRRIMRPLRIISKQLLELDGDLTFRADYAEKKDEIGAIARGVNSFIEKLQNLIVGSKETSEQMYELSQNIEKSSETAAVSLDRQKKSTDAFVESISQLSQSASGMALNAEEVAKTTNDAAEVTNRGTEQVKIMIGSMNNVTQRVDTAVLKVGALNEAAQQIKMILSVISSISEKTSLLALNAAIEAARAGDAGRGFAVVADEIRTLATRTKNSTVEISQVIGELQDSTSELNCFMLESQTDTKETMEIASQTALLLKEIADLTGRINGMITQMSATAEEQSVVTGTLSEQSGEIAKINDEIHRLLIDQSRKFMLQQEYASRQKELLDIFTV